MTFLFVAGEPWLGGGANLGLQLPALSQRPEDKSSRDLGQGGR